MALSIAAMVAAPPTASLSFFACSRSALGRSSIALPKAAAIPRSPSLLSTSFLSAPSSFLSSSSSSSFGLSLGIDLGCNRVVRERFRLLQVRAGKPFMVKRSRSLKSLARTHGFRRRMRTTGGREVLRRRRAKGRHVLCTKSHPNSRT